MKTDFKSMKDRRFSRKVLTVFDRKLGVIYKVKNYSYLWNSQSKENINNVRHYAFIVNP